MHEYSMDFLNGFLNGFFSMDFQWISSGFSMDIFNGYFHEIFKPSLVAEVVAWICNHNVCGHRSLAMRLTRHNAAWQSTHELAKALSKQQLVLRRRRPRSACRNPLCGPCCANGGGPNIITTTRASSRAATTTNGDVYHPSSCLPLSLVVCL